MKRITFLFLFLTVFQLVSLAQETFFAAQDNRIRYSGRIDRDNPDETILIGSASSIEVAFTGDFCTVLLKNISPAGLYNFYSIEIDGEYYGRGKLAGDSIIPFGFAPKTKADKHILRLVKATEAQNGYIAVDGVKCKNLESLPKLPKRKIEFIGNSITCGMGIEWKEIPCNTGQWYDQHNAYFAYGPLSAKALNAQFMLSSVSGIGIYRNWNSPGPAMPAVYENMYLNTDKSKKWDFSAFTPDLVSICLGTNDFSNGDGSSERTPFDSASYVSAYINFVNTVYSHYPWTQVCLLTSPMVNGPQARMFEKCIDAVKAHFDNVEPRRKLIAVYYFSDFAPHGCDSHPDKGDHRQMAELLAPFYKKVMGW